MSEITKTALPQLAAGNAMQGSASRPRDASGAAGEGGDAFSRVLDQQMSNRREAARSEESAHQRGAQGEAPREAAPAGSDSARAATAEKPERKTLAKDTDAKDAKDPDGRAVATDAGSEAQAAAGIAALLPGLAAGVAAQSAAGRQAPEGATAIDTEDAQADLSAQVALKLAVDEAGRPVRADLAETAAPAEASDDPVQDSKLLRPETGIETTDTAEADAVPVQAPRLSRNDGDKDLTTSAAGTLKDAAKPSASAADSLAALASTPANDGTAAQMSMHTAATARSQGAAANQPMPAYIATPAGRPGWAEDVGNRVVLLAGRDESAAELILTPPHLGRVEVSIRVSGEHTTAHFVAASPAARDALDQAMPRLREVLAEAGISLGDANVNTQAQQQRGEGGSGGHYRPRYGNEMTGESPVVASQMWLRRSDGLIDTFA